jgi:hypothetical protein
VTLVLGLSAVGLAVATLSRNPDQAMPSRSSRFLPISGIWFPLEGAPDWVTSAHEGLPARAHRPRVRPLLVARRHRRRLVARRPAVDRRVEAVGLVVAHPPLPRGGGRAGPAAPSAGCGALRRVTAGS